MGNFEIIKRNGERIPLNTVEPFCVVKSAVQNSSLMGDDNVQLSIIQRIFSLSQREIRLWWMVRSTLSEQR